MGTARIFELPCHGAMMSCQPYSGASNLSACYTAQPIKAGYADLNRCPAAAWSPACRSGPCNCLSAARPSIFCLNVLFRSAPWKSRLFRAPWQHVTALARWLVTARRLRAKPLHRAHVCVRKDAWRSPWLEADRAGWLKRLRRTLRFLLPTSAEAIVLDFVSPMPTHVETFVRSPRLSCCRIDECF